MPDPASIRYKNPGAIWGGAHARQWGAIDDVVLSDGENNHIAVFPTFIDGAAAQFDLWRKGYAGMTLPAAIKKWSGGNSSSQYAAFLCVNTSIGADEPITLALLSGARGIALMKQQARWEAGLTKSGQSYPMSDADWQQAQNLVFGVPNRPPDISLQKSEPPQPASGGFFAAVNNAVLSIFKRS